MLDRLIELGFEIDFHSHAKAILLHDFPDALEELETALSTFSVPIEELIASGGGEAKGTQRLRKALAELGWTKGTITVEKRINAVPRESVSHTIDHLKVRGDNKTIALEIEWNNKDPFFDRDLENFKRLHAEGAISLGAVVTRGTSLQDEMRSIVSRFCDFRNICSFDDLENFGITPTKRQRTAVLKRVLDQSNHMEFRKAWTEHFVADKFGAATTHWRKLQDRVSRGVGNPCPLLLIGIPSSVVTFAEPQAVVQELLEAGLD